MSYESADDKITKEKSAFYPYFGLNDCLEFAKKVQKLAGKSVIKDKALATDMGISPTNKNFKYKISSTKQFGLIDKTKEGLQITEIARNILNPVDLKDVPSMQLELFQIPILYKKIIQKYNGMDLPHENSLANLMYNEYGIARAAKERAAKIFIESAKLCKALDESGRLNLERIEQNPVVKKPIEVNEIEEQSEIEGEVDLLKKEKSFYQTVKLAFSGSRVVELVVPSDLNSKEAERLKKQIDLLVVE